MVHADANFLLHYIFPSCMLLQPSQSLNRFQICNNPTSSPTFSALALCLYPGFSSAPEDLLPDFDLKIMPGRGVILSPPDLVLYILAALMQYLE